MSDADLGRIAKENMERCHASIDHMTPEDQIATLVMTLGLCVGVFAKSCGENAGVIYDDVIIEGRAIALGV